MAVASPRLEVPRALPWEEQGYGCEMRHGKEVVALEWIFLSHGRYRAYIWDMEAIKLHGF